MSIYSIGLSGLQAAQLGMTTTGNNITNAQTPGYSREEIVQATQPSQQFGYGFVGQGTQVNTIKRIYDQYLNTQVNTATSSSSELNTYSTQISQIDNMVANTTSGLSPALQDFFNSVQNLAASPSATAGTPARQAMLSTGNEVVSRFQSLQGNLDNIMSGTNSQITDTLLV